MVSFEFKDYYHNGSKLLFTLKTIEFIRKLVRHIPPHYFNVIRHYGLLASRVKSKYKKITDKLSGKARDVKKHQNWQERQIDFCGENPMLCRICGKIMVFVEVHFLNPLSMVIRNLQSIFL